MEALPSLSVVIEFENAGRVGEDRALRMLASLHHQLGTLPERLIGDCEILFVYSPAQVREGWLHGATAELGGWPAELRFLASEDPGYYELKNYGADHARGDIILFLDSDVVPEEGWLRALLEQAAKGAGIVAGSTSVERSGLYSTAMALGWIFPMRSQTERRPHSIFYANNVAFRRELRAVMRFPRTEQYRVQVGAVHRALTHQGHRVAMCHDACVLHPPPQGLSGFVTRALWCGYDSSTVHRRASTASFLFAADAARALGRVVRGRRAAGLGVVGTAAALGIIGTYHAIRLLGFAAALIAPQSTRRQLRRVAP